MKVLRRLAMAALATIMFMSADSTMAKPVYLTCDLGARVMALMVDEDRSLVEDGIKGAPLRGSHSGEFSADKIRWHQQVGLKDYPDELDRRTLMLYHSTINGVESGQCLIDEDRKI